MHHLQKKISLNKSNIERTTLQYNTISKLLEERLVYLYKMDQDLIYEKLFGSESIKNSITNDYAYKKIFQSDHHLLEQLNQTHLKLKNQQHKLHNSKQQKSTLVSKIKREKVFSGSIT